MFQTIKLVSFLRTLRLLQARVQPYAEGFFTGAVAAMTLFWGACVCTFTIVAAFHQLLGQ